MKNNILKFQIISAIFVSILGTLLHFTFEWSGENYVIGVFSAVNESTWEHLKLLFFPLLITAIVGYFYFCDSVPNFLCAKTLGIISAILFTIIFFYTSSGIIGKNIAALNIATFYIAVVIGEYLAYRIMNSTFKCNKNISIFALILLLVAFITFTYSTPQIGLFEDPITGDYGILF